MKRGSLPFNLNYQKIAINGNKDPKSSKNESSFSLVQQCADKVIGLKSLLKTYEQYKLNSQTEKYLTTFITKFNENIDEVIELVEREMRKKETHKRKRSSFAPTPALMKRSSVDVHLNRNFGLNNLAALGSQSPRRGMNSKQKNNFNEPNFLKNYSSRESRKKELSKRKFTIDPNPDDSDDRSTLEALKMVNEEVEEIDLESDKKSVVELKYLSEKYSKAHEIIQEKLQEISPILSKPTSPRKKQKFSVRFSTKGDDLSLIEESEENKVKHKLKKVLNSPEKMKLVQEDLTELNQRKIRMIEYEKYILDRRKELVNLEKNSLNYINLKEEFKYEQNKLSIRELDILAREGIVSQAEKEVSLREDQIKRDKTKIIQKKNNLSIALTQYDDAVYLLEERKIRIKEMESQLLALKKKCISDNNLALKSLSDREHALLSKEHSLREKYRLLSNKLNHSDPDVLLKNLNIDLEI
ncbi:unnamed protein product [Moneuplotes crassus]|uniref:Uncharacterized protein n=1 Tax=Euplotes crassus TaxID=5936 RepID=A0AAD1XF39_EUPCR|nr:unnamed protein product [Moneuplotes crassus]